MGSIFIGGISFMLSSFSLTFINLSLTLFVGACCCIIINVTCNVCTMKLYRGEGQDFWIQLLHTVFGIGGLVGPFLVAIFGSSSYFILGIILAFCSVFYLFLQNPDSGEEGRVT